MGSTVTWIGKSLPTVIMTPEVKRDMEIICKNAGTDEIGWLGLVSRDIDENIFKVYKILPLPKQEVHSATTELTPEGQAELMMDMLESGEITTEETNNIRFWGHSHVNMSPTPSGQDNTQMSDLTDNLEKEEGAVNRFFVRCITNKKSEYHFSIFQYDMGIALVDAPWHLEMEENDSRVDYWKEQIEDKVSKLRTNYTYVRGGAQPVNSPKGGGYPHEYEGYGYGGYGGWETGMNTNPPPRIQQKAGKTKTTKRNKVKNKDYSFQKQGV